MRASWTKSRLLAAALAGLVAAVPVPALGWQKYCVSVPALKDPATAPETSICYTFADVRDESTQILVARFGILQLSRRNDAKLLLVLALGSALPGPMLVETDSGERFEPKLIKGTCYRYGCYETAPLDEGTLHRLRGTKSFVLMGNNSIGWPFRFPVPAGNFQEVLSGPPSPEDKDQPYIAKALRDDWRLLFEIP